MALVFNNLSSILLNEEDALNQESINKKIDALVSNDRLIYDSFGNSIGRWHCYWYYDSNIKGYSKGDLVWLNVEDPYTFIRNHYAVIKNYTDLRAEVQRKLPEFTLTDDEVIERYLNALSGYVDSKSPNIKPLEPIFDLGDYTKPIQLVVSLIDNNKTLVSDERGWKKLFVDDDNSEKKIVETVSCLNAFKLEQHLIDYHLSGQEEYVKAQLSDYIDVPKNTPTYSTAPTGWYRNFNSEINERQYGLDYVTHFIRKPFLVSGEVSQYQAVRYWKSGWMEHFGTIATSNEAFAVSGGNFIKIPLYWNIVDVSSGSKAYENGELAKSVLNVLSATESESNIVPPKDNFINVLVGRSSIDVDGKQTVRPFKDNSYNIVVTPIYQNQDGIDEDYIDANYGDDSFQQNWNNNFLTNEIIEEYKSRFYFIMRLNTRVLPPYISYYATGLGDFNG